MLTESGYDKDIRVRVHTFLQTHLTEGNMLKKFIRNDKGATAIEYGLIAAIIGVGCIVALGQVKADLNTVFTKVSTELAKAPN